MSIFSYGAYALKENACNFVGSLAAAVLNPHCHRAGVITFGLVWRETYRIFEKIVKPVFDKIRTVQPVSSHLQEKVTDLVHFTAGCAVAYAFFGNKETSLVLPLILVVENAIRRRTDYVSTTLRRMTLDDKVGQLLMVGFNGYEDARILIQDARVGGMIYYASNGLQERSKVRALSQFLQNVTRYQKKPALLIATDQEGGIVSRLDGEFTQFPGNTALTTTGRPALARQAALAMGAEMRDVGINMNFAPCVDVNSNPFNPVIGLRSFGSNARIVTEFAECAVMGYKRSDVIPVLKHFPGHGDTSQDSHVALPVVSKPLQQLQQCDLSPFAQLAKQVDCIMTAHIKTELDPTQCATLSEKSLKYLRNALGFDGLIITDSLVMQGVLQECLGIDRAAIRALKAGNDMLLLGGRVLIGNTPHELRAKDVLRIKDSIVAAVCSGEIPMSRIDEAVTRILKLKLRRLHHVGSTFVETYMYYPRSSSQIRLAKHQALSLTIASKAIRIIRGTIPRITQSNAVVYAPEMLRPHIEQYCHITAKSYFGPEETEIKKRKSLIVFFSYNAWKFPNQQKLIHSAILKSNVVLVETGYPNYTPSGATAVINTHSPKAPSIQAVCEALRKSSDNI